MITGIIMTQHKYVLKDDRGSNPEEQTIFYVVPKTVRSQNETAAAYAEVSVTDRKTGATQLNPKKLNVVDDQEWCRAVKRIDNFFIPEGAPENSCDIFLAEADASENLEIKAVLIGGKEIRGVLVKSTADPEEIRRIRLAMSPDHVSEVMDAYYNYSQLTGSEKN